MLGRYLVAGVVDPPNLLEAREWLEQAVAQGIAEAQSDLASLPAPATVDSSQIDTDR